MAHSPPGLRLWAAQCRLHEPERRHPFKIIRAGHADELDACARFCHQMITDRDQEFTLEKRTRLYARWAAGGQPWMVVTHDEQGGILTGSIILSLTEDAYRRFWHDGALDALDITPAELAGAASAGRHKYFLIDILAMDKSLIRRLPEAARREACGLGLRTLTYHLSLFHPPGATPNPVLLCSTYSPELMAVLAMAGFERKQGQGELAAPIFRLDTGQTKGLTADQQWLLDGARATLIGYVNRRAPAPAQRSGSARPDRSGRARSR